jgi:hypothetical protein
MGVPVRFLLKSKGDFMNDIEWQPLGGNIEIALSEKHRFSTDFGAAVLFRLSKKRRRRRRICAAEAERFRFCGF